MNIELSKKDIDHFLEMVHKHHNCDLRNYARASVTRRIIRLMIKQGHDQINDLISDIQTGKTEFDDIVYNFSIKVTEMFRNPPFFQILRETVVPILKDFPKVNIWHAGCSTGEEVYSLAIILKEEGLYENVMIYATDFNEKSLSIANQGITSLKEIEKFEDNYRNTGGKASLSDYYHIQSKSVVFDKALSKNVKFFNHNMVSEKGFGQMHLILCRNVLIYFNKGLQDKTLSLFNENLKQNCFLAIGSKETINFSSIEKKYEPISKKYKIYRKL
jgi:chemotaxis protein methyltransferase CheR